MVELLVTAALVFAAVIIFSFSPVYGIAILTAFRPLFLLASVPMGRYDYSAEGILTLVIIGVGAIYIMQRGTGLLKGVVIWPFIVFIIYCGLTFVGAADIANFLKKFARLIGYFFLYVMIVDLSREEGNRRILVYSIIASFFVTNLPAIYVYCIAPEKYIRAMQGLSTRSQQMDVGVMAKNNFGFYCCYMAFFLLYVYATVKSKVSKSIILGMFMTQVGLLVISYTRSAWAGFAAGLPLLVLFGRSKAKFLVPLLAITLVGASFFSIISYGAYRDVTEKKEVGFSSWHHRVAYAWPASIKAIKERPIMGWGLGNDLYALTQAAKLKGTSHNDYLLICVEAGLIGGLLYLWLLFSLARRTIVTIRGARDERTKLLGRTAFATFVAFGVGSIGEHLLQTPGATGYVITILGMAHGAIEMHGSNPEIEESPHEQSAAFA